MAHCQAQDCPAPSIDYTILEKLSNGILVCPFCFVRLSTKVEVEYESKPMKKATVSGLTKIPPLQKQNTIFSEFKEKNPVISAGISSTEIYTWNNICSILSQQIGRSIPQIKNIIVISFKHSPRLLFTEEDTYLIKFVQNTEGSTSSAAKMIFSYFRVSLAPELSILVSSLPSEIQQWMCNTFPFIKEQSLNNWCLELTHLFGKTYPLTEFIDLGIENLNIQVLIEEFSKLAYIGWLVGKVDLIESCLISIINNNISIVLFDTHTPKQSFDPLIERNLYQLFPLYMPYLLDYTDIFLESSKKQKLQIQKCFVSDPVLKQIFDKFYKEKNMQQSLDDFSKWPDFSLY